MRVVIAPGRYAGTLTAPQAAQAIAAGWRRAAPDDVLLLHPMSDGGPGLVEALGGPPGEPMHLIGDTAGVAYLESARVCTGDPAAASTLGVGALLAAAVEAGASTVVIGMNGVRAVDGGAGLVAGLAAAWHLGSPLLDRVGGAALRGVGPDDLAVLALLRERLAGVRLVAAVDVELPLLGFKGAAAVEGPAKGADADLVQRLDAALTDWAGAVLQAADLPQKLVVEPGAGAGGGLGFGVLALGGRLEPGAALIARTTGLPDLLGPGPNPTDPADRTVRADLADRADLAVTGEGTLDWASLGSCVLTAVAGLAQERGIPTVTVPGRLQVGSRELLSVGVDAAYPLARSPAQLAAALADPAQTLAARAERVARTWSR